MTAGLDRLEGHTIPEPMSGCWIWTASLDAGGYGRVNVGGTAVLAHRQMWKESKGAIPQGLKVLHQCDVRCCVNPDHLFLGTQAENVCDMIEKGRDRKAYGEAHHKAKLSTDQVLAIRSSPLSAYRLAKDYGVSKASIQSIKRGLTWRHLCQRQP